MVCPEKPSMAAAVGTTLIAWIAAAAAACAVAGVVVGEQRGNVPRPLHQSTASSLVDDSALRRQAAASRLALPQPPMSQEVVEVVHATS
jgi:hypothetical protein